MPRMTNRMRAWVRILAPMALMIGAFGLLFSPAYGADLTGPGETITTAPQAALLHAAGVQPAVVDRGGVSNPMPACASVGRGEDPIKCLPIVRWASSMKLGDSVEFNVTQPLRSIEVNMIEKTSFTTILEFGNFLWLAAALLVNAVTNFEVNALLAKPLNDFAATFGSSIIDSGAIFLILTVGVVTLVLGAMRGRFGARRLAMMIASLGIFTAMDMGSMNDRGEGTSYDPGTFSPAWMVQELSGAFTKASDAIAAPISNRSSQASTVFSDEAKSDPTSCKSYIDALHSQYTGYYDDIGQTAPAALDVMSRWWEETAYRAYATIQYGDQSSRGADYAACQQLETNTNIAPGDRVDILAGAYASGDTDYSAAVPPVGSPMLNGGFTNDDRTARQNQAWGLCQASPDGTYTLRSDLPADGIEGGKIGGPLTPEACTQIFTGEGVNNETGIVFALPFADTVSPDVTVKQVKDIQFAVVGDAGLLSNPENGLAEHAEAYSYVSNTAGTIRTSTTLVAITYAISALIGSLAMAFLAAALFIMKLLSHVMAFFLIIAALAGVISQGFGSAASFFKGWIGYTAITSVTTLLFAIVLLIAMALIRAGDAVLGGWATAMMLWIGACPALAIFVLNWMFKKLFRTRSPFTIRGMQAMAGNPLAVAGAVGGGGALTKNLLEQGRRKLTGAAMDTAKGRLLGRKDTANSKSAAANEELVGDATNTPQVEADTSKQNAITSGTEGAKGTATDGAKDSEDTPEVEGEGENAEKVAGGKKTSVAGDQVGKHEHPGVEVKGEVDDASLVADSIVGPDSAPDARTSFGTRLEAFATEGRHDGQLDGAVERAAGVVTAAGTGATSLGRHARLALHRVRSVPENVRRQISGGAGMLQKKWADGKATRSAIWNNKALTAQYLATRGVGAATKVVGTAGTKLAAAVTNPATYKAAVKGAALYGGLALASGGLAVPAAVMGGRALLKHRRNLAHGAATAVGTGAAALTGLAKTAYRAGIPEMSTTDRQEVVESMELDSRIRADQSENTRAPITELAHGLPIVQERQLAAELRDANESFDAFEAENGRTPDLTERAAMVDGLPFFASMNDDAQLRALFEERVAAESAQAQGIFDAHAAEDGAEIGPERMRALTKDLPFYAQSIRGLDPRQGTLQLTGAGNASALRVDAGNELRSYDPLAARTPIAVPVGQEAFDLEGSHEQR
ncbi:Yip1 family protein [Brachybacterium atlanticum]|uniref:Yip1 family protein n=1 Tax=Brachybacterium atlanticum TaxID=2911888 RepID=UPI0021E02A93|nr:Yip1 family protein [Brachybacterium atlanticum]